MNKKLLLILLLALLVRLVHINFPISGWHSWRQADTGAIARNFYESGQSILYPQVDWAGNSNGFVESEFHIYPYIVSILYHVFGVDDMWGRIVSVIFSLFTILGLFLLVRKYVNEKTALWSAFIYAVIPMNIYFGRAFMPESAMLCCSVYGIYFFSEWIDKNNLKNFLFATLFVSLAILIKLPTAYIGLPLLFLALNKYGSRAFVNWKIILFVLLVFIPVVLWYNHAHQLLLNGGVSFGIWDAGTDKWGNFDLIITPKFYNDIFLVSIAERHLTYAAFIMMIAGLFIKRRSKNELLFDWWLISVIVYFLIVAKGNNVHDYYQLPFALPASVFIGKAFAKVFDFGSIKESFSKRRLIFSVTSIALVCLLLLSFFRMSNFIKQENINSPIFELSREMNNEDEGLVITVSSGNPVVLYNSHRKGWVAWASQIDSSFIANKINEGARYVIGEKGELKSEQDFERIQSLMGNYKTIKNEDGYYIIELSSNQ